MAVEKISIDVEVKNNVKKWLSDVRDDITGFNKRIKSDTAINLSINVAKLNTELKQVRWLIKEAEKKWDFNAAVQLRADEERLKQQLTWARRELRNFARTGEKDVSVLGKLFQWVGQEIEKTRQELIKAWKSTKEVDKISVALKENKISAEQAKKELGNINKSKFNWVKGALWWVKGALWWLKTQIVKLWWLFAWLFAAKKLIQFTNQVDKARSNIVKLTWASWDLLKTLTDSTSKVFKTVPEDIDKIWTAVWEINTRFWSTWKELEILTKDFLDFARITRQDVQPSIRQVSRLMWDWWIETESTSYLLDVLTKASQSTGANLNTLTNTVTNFWVQFRTLWFNLEESIALLSKWEAEWVSVQKVTSWLTLALNNLAVKWFKDPIQAFKDYSESIKEATTDTEAIIIAQEIFWRRAGADLAIAIREWRFEIDELVLSLQNADGALTETAKSSLTLAQRTKIVWNQFKWELIPILEDLLPIFQKIVDFTPKIINWWKAVYITLTWFIAELLFRFNIFWNNVIWTFQNVLDNSKIIWNSITSTIAMVMANSLAKVASFWAQARKVFSNLTDNIWTAFGNIWPLIWKWLNLATKPLNSFLNWFIKTYNNTVWRIWPKITWEANIWVDFWETKWFTWIFDWVKEAWEEASKTFSDTANSIVSESQKTINDINSNIEKRNNETKNKNAILEEAQRLNAQETANKLEQLWLQTQKDEEARLNNRIKNNKDALDSIFEDEENLNDKKTWWTKKALKTEEELLQEQLEKQKKYFEEKQKQEDEANKTKIDNLEKAVETVWEILDKEIEQSTKSIEEYQNQINKLKDSIDWLNDKLQELEQWRAKTLWERNIKIDEELVKLRKEEIQDTEAINKLLEEKRLIEANATQAELDEAKRINELSPTARFLEEFEQKKLALEEERELKEQQVADLEEQKLEEEAILETFTDKKIFLDENYAKIRAKIEEEITNKTILEADKQISKLEELRQKAIEAAEAMRSAWLNVWISEENRPAWNTSNTNITQTYNISNEVDATSVIRDINKNIK